jgi:glycosyltransferase involved in cell wall biosynthesis
VPTYREGFPTVFLEAAAMELPVVGTRIPGCVNAVEDGKTGTLVAPYDARGLTGVLRVYLGDAEFRRQHGRAGRRRVLREFRPEGIAEALFQEYLRLLRDKGISVPPQAPHPALTSVGGTGLDGGFPTQEVVGVVG